LLLVQWHGVLATAQLGLLSHDLANATTSDRIKATEHHGNVSSVSQQQRPLRGWRK
jgi:hypothetical protein